jgi:hypothetical protein
MGDDITIGVTEIINNIEVTAQPNDQIVEIDVVDNSDEVTLNITPTVIEININKGSSFARWGDILGNLPDQEDLQNVLNLKADLVGGLVPASQLPSYVDDIIEVANYAALPTTGEVGKIYVTLDNNKIFRWSGSVYIEIAANTGVWGAITGTLSSQTDLQTALDTKALKTITITPSAPLSGGGDLSANRTISISQSNATTDGYLSSIDWNTFNGKQTALNGTGFVKVSGTTVSYDNSTYALDSVVVKLTGDQSISGIKTFSSLLKSSILLINEAGGFSGATGYSQLGGTADYFIIVNGTGAKQTKFIHNGIRNITMPASDGTMALTSQIPTVSGTTNYVPKFTGSNTIGDSVIFDDGTQIGIGTNVPQRKLSVRDVNNTYGATFSGSAGSNIVAIGTVAGATNGVPAIQGFTNLFGTTTNLTLNPTGGNVGIGTTSPSSLLHLSGSSTSPITHIIENNNAGTSAGTKLSLRYNGVETAYLYNRFNGGDFNTDLGSADYFRILTAGSEKMRILTNGNVGINTTSPTLAKLHVKGDNGSAIAYLYNNSGTAGQVNGLAVEAGTNSSDYALSIGSSLGTSYLKVIGNGNVGINTSSPGAKLEVNGASILGGALNSDWAVGVNNTGTTSANGMYVNIGASSTGVPFAVYKNFSPLAFVTNNGDLLVGTSTANYGAVNRGNITVNGTSNAIFGLNVGGVNKGYFYHEGTNAYIENSVSGGNLYVISGGTNGVYLPSGGIAWLALSDEKLKTDLVPIKDGLNKVCSLRSVIGRYKTDDESIKRPFLIAQDVEKVLPEAVSKDETTGNLAVSYSEVIPLLVAAIKELKAEIEILKTK